jgi:hypothetical protein
MGNRCFKIKRFLENILEKIKLFFQDISEFFRKIRDHNITFKIFRTITRAIKKLLHGLRDYVLGWDERISTGKSFHIHED